MIYNIEGKTNEGKWVLLKNTQNRPFKISAKSAKDAVNRAIEYFGDSYFGYRAKWSAYLPDDKRT